MIIMALGLRRARVGMIPLYRSTLVWTTLTYDCSLLHALEVTTMTLEPAEADKSDKEEICLVKSHIVKQQTLQNSSRRSKPHCCCVKSPLNSGVLLLWRGVKVTAECSTAAPRYSVSARRHRGESSRTGSLSTMPVSLPLIWQQWLSPVARSRYCVTVQNDVPLHTSTFGRLKISRSVEPPLVELSATSMKTSLSTWHWINIKRGENHYWSIKISYDMSS